jgi:hypothetical protein
MEDMLEEDTFGNRMLVQEVGEFGDIPADPRAAGEANFIFPVLGFDLGCAEVFEIAIGWVDGC